MWSPTSEGAYAGTCIFLIVLGASYSILTAVRRAIFEAPTFGTGLLADTKQPSAMQRLRAAWVGNRFRIATETSRALFEVVVVGIGYLL
jgi:solute carrier family 31 (copper transporter), member 1